ncbi:hypothetical protein PR048_027968 [Dryococelus australis]|uniref:Transmembrane protein n=1 Tax=Dryococelus australis TaxID=614101 RepID=A0ABQ9GHX2_9NEOP|nr:hypothetical protein PR048_027968 [Dryococelus australis]
MPRQHFSHLEEGPGPKSGRGCWLLPKRSRQDNGNNKEREREREREKVKKKEVAAAWLARSFEKEQRNNERKKIVEEPVSRAKPVGLMSGALSHQLKPVLSHPLSVFLPAISYRWQAVLGTPLLLAWAHYSLSLGGKSWPVECFQDFTQAFGSDRFAVTTERRKLVRLNHFWGFTPLLALRILARCGRCVPPLASCRPEPRAVKVFSEVDGLRHGRPSSSPDETSAGVQDPPCVCAWAALCVAVRASPTLFPLPFAVLALRDCTLVNRQAPAYLQLLSAFDAEKRGSDKGDADTRYKSAIAPTREALNLRALTGEEGIVFPAGQNSPTAQASFQFFAFSEPLGPWIDVRSCLPPFSRLPAFNASGVSIGPSTSLSWKRHDGHTARLARRSDEALGVRVTVARISPSLLDLGRGAVVAGYPRENPPTSGIVRLDSHKRKSGCYPAGNRTEFA